MADTCGIAELASEFGITTRTIRFYEDQGLIAPDRSGQRRVYAPRDRVRLKLIMRGKRLGFSLDEIREMIDIYDADPTEKAQLHLVLERIAERRAALDPPATRHRLHARRTGGSGGALLRVAGGEGGGRLGGGAGEKP